LAAVNTKLYVSNLASGTTKKSLRNLFEGNGRKVDRVAVAKNPDSTQATTTGLVQMTTVEDARAAIEALNGHEVGGLELAVRIARIRPAKKDGRA
jgi:RNA recognition motif-containing protein